MARLIVRGGIRLKGVHRSPGNKNSALPMLAACLLTDEPLVLDNVPQIEDVRTMLAILSAMGVCVQTSGRRVRLDSSGVKTTTLDPTLCRIVRSSVLLAGPVPARFGRLTLYPPGGDIIGRRPLDTHFQALARMGVRISCGKGAFNLRREGSRLRGGRILLDEASVTATETAIMASCLAQGETEIFNAACEPHVRDLCDLLRKMGARITGDGTNLVRVSGVRSLGGAEHAVSPDYVDSASFIAAGILTGGNVSVGPVRPDDWEVIGRVFDRLGCRCAVTADQIAVRPGHRLRVQAAVGGAIPKIEDGPWPAFPSDLMSLAVVMATQASGTVLFFEKMFESRLYFVDRLIEMGARIVPCDPHRVVVSGPVRLKGITMASPDIRAGIALVVAALCARGESIIENAQSIDRGYENVDAQLRLLGADIERVD